MFLRQCYNKIKISELNKRLNIRTNSYYSVIVDDGLGNETKIVTIFGLNENNLNIGKRVLDDLKKSDFKGSMYAINNNDDNNMEMDNIGIQRINKLKEIQKPIDLAIVIPDHNMDISDIIKECGENKVKGITNKGENNNKGQNILKKYRDLIKEYNMKSIDYSMLEKYVFKEENVNEKKMKFDKNKERIYSENISYAIKNNEIEKAEMFLKELINNENVRANLINYSSVIKGFGMIKNDLEKAEYYFNIMMNDESIHPDIILYCIMINACTSAKNLERAKYYYDLIEKDDLIKGPNIYVFNAMLKCCKVVGNMEQAEYYFGLIKESKRPDIAPDSYTYSLIIDNCRNIERAEYYLDMMMKDKSITPNIRIVNTILNLCSKIRNLTKMEYYFNHFFTENNYNSSLKPDKYSYNLMIICSSVTKNLDKADYYFKLMMKDESNHPNVSVFNAMLDCCAKIHNKENFINKSNDRAEHYFNILTELSNEKLNPDIISYCSMIKCFTKVKNPDKAEYYFNLMLNHNNYHPNKVTPNLISFNLIISCFSKSGNLFKAQTYFNLMNQFYISPNLYIINSMINCCSKTNDTESAENYFHQILESPNLSPDIITYSSIIDCCVNAKHLEKAEYYHNLMLENNIKPNLIIYNSLIKGYSKCKNIEMVEKYYKIIKEEKNIVPDSYTFSQIINCFGYSDQIDRAILYAHEYVNLVSSNQIKPDKHPIKNIKHFLTSDEYDQFVYEHQDQKNINIL